MHKAKTDRIRKRNRFTMIIRDSKAAFQQMIVFIRKLSKI